MCAVSSGLLSGCVATRAQNPGVVATTRYVSFTDEASRLRALDTQKMLSERSEDYRIGPEDVLDVTIFEWELREETKTVETRVAESGVVSLPVIGDVVARGLTVAEVKKEVESRLVNGGFIMEPRVSVTVKEFRSKKIAVVGSVVDPGVYTLRQNVTTLLDILSLSGGPNEKAGYVVYIVRTRSATSAPGAEGLLAKRSEESGGSGTETLVSAITLPSMADPPPASNQEVIAIDLYELMETGNLALNAVLCDGDVVNVPEAKRFSVLGYVREPGSFPLKKPMTVLEGLAFAKGFKNPEASPRSCVLRRYVSGGESIIPLDFIAISEGKSPNFYLAPNDVIEVRQTPGKKAFLDVMDGFKYIFNVGYTF